MSLDIYLKFCLVRNIFYFFLCFHRFFVLFVCAVVLKKKNHHEISSVSSVLCESGIHAAKNIKPSTSVCSVKVIFTSFKICGLCILLVESNMIDFQVCEKKTEGIMMNLILKCFCNVYMPDKQRYNWYIFLICVISSVTLIFDFIKEKPKEHKGEIIKFNIFWPPG